MRSKTLRIPCTQYGPMAVWNGNYHRVRIRFRDKRHIQRDRGTLHTIISRAASFKATRRLTIDRTSRGKWHTLDIGNRALAKRFMVEIELLVIHRIVEVELDGNVVYITKKKSSDSSDN
jgi:hypothetical protein